MCVCVCVCVRVRGDGSIHASRYTITIDKKKIKRDWWKRIVKTIFYAVRFVFIICVPRLLLSILYSIQYTSRFANKMQG